jgi:predicted small lipoprotein YifL
MHYYISNLLLVVALLALPGCGQMGPLYMPPEETPPPPALSEPSAAPDADERAKQSQQQP